MKTEDLLLIWEPDEKGRFVPLSHSFVLGKIEAFRPDDDSATLFRNLRESGWIEILPNGEWALTKQGLSARPGSSSVGIAVSTESDADREAAWRKFRRLCDYYSDCVLQQEQEAEYLFDNQFNTRFFLPALPFGWTKAEAPFAVSATQEQGPAFRLVSGVNDESARPCIGYPLERFETSTGGWAYTPLLLVPVHFTRTANRTLMEIERDGIDINQAWLKFNVPKEEQREILAAVSCHDGDRKGLIDLPAAISFLSNRFRDRIDSPLDPDRLSFDIWHGDGIVNAAALFLEDNLKYSRSLAKELSRIRNESAAVLDRTALAYVFREPPLPNGASESPHEIALDFLPSNTEQHEAVEEALNKPVSKVTGPPGTGKSQVAVNLVGNLVFRGRPVLFTSKNHKAIHAIDEKVASLHPDMPLVQFCSQSDGGSGAVWFKQDLDLQLGALARCREELRGRGRRATIETSEAMNRIRDCLPIIRDIEKNRDAVSDAASRLEENREAVSGIGVEIDQRLESNLERLIPKLKPVLETRTSLVRRILDLLFRRRKRTENAREALKSLLPGFDNEFDSIVTLKSRAERLLAGIKGIRSAEEELKALEEESAGFPDYDKLLRHLSETDRVLKERQSDALVEEVAERAEQTNPDVLQRLRDATSFLKHQNLPFFSDLTDLKQVTEAQNAFIGYSRLFPAWACTLLSLSKAAPCVPAVFDRVIVDEASQCEIPPIIPALFRAKGVTVIGDPRQFPPVITMREERNAYLRLAKHGLSRIEDERFDFRGQNAYSVVNVPPVELRDHFRCHPEIADYFNDAFYRDRLRVQTDESRLRFPKGEGFHPGREWRNVVDSLDGEISEAEHILEELVQLQFDGSIGVVTPFRDVANRLQTKLHRYSGQLAGFDSKTDVSTANGFQGGERDLIVFVLAYTSEIGPRKTWYTTSDENRYIFNVAVSRARACLIVVGDRVRAGESGFQPLVKLSQPPRPRRKVFDSPCEEMLFRAMKEAGLDPVPQYPLAGRFLDLALPNEKIDVEIDGEAYHLDSTGSRKKSDIFRDRIVQSNGWRVKRFWARRVISDTTGCVSEIKKLLAK